MLTQFYNPQDAFVQLLEHVVEQGEVIVVRGSETKEVRNAAFTIKHPTQRCLLLPHRNDNIFAKIAETMWVLAGRNDIYWLKFFLPRAPEWSDDGKTWRAGYGPRLRKWRLHGAPITFGDYLVNDQVDECRKLLVEDPNTRRAVMSLWDPADDYQARKDIPCNNWLHWLIRDGKLHLNITQRSSDILWGFSGINLFEWGVLQQCMARWTNCDVGELTYFISSLHLYKQHYERAEKIISADNGADLYVNKFSEFVSPAVTVPFDKLDTMLAIAFSVIDNVIHGGNVDELKLDDPFFNLCTRMVCLHAYDKAHQDHPQRADALCEMLSSLPTSDFRLAAIEYYLRTVPDVVAIATKSELQALEVLGLYQ